MLTIDSYNSYLCTLWGKVLSFLKVELILLEFITWEVDLPTNNFQG